MNAVPVTWLATTGIALIAAYLGYLRYSQAKLTARVPALRVYTKPETWYRHFRTHG